MTEEKTPFDDDKEPEINLTELPSELLNGKLIGLFEFNPKVWIAGGAVRDSIFRNKINDIDVFAENIESLDKFRATMKDAKIIHDAPMMKTYLYRGYKVQLIERWHAGIKQCLQYFDFTLCQFAYQEIDKQPHVYCSARSLVDVAQKRIIVNNIQKDYAVDSLRRLQKYIQRGYTICSGGLKDIAISLSGLTVQDIDNQVQYYSDGSPRILRYD